MILGDLVPHLSLSGFLGQSSLKEELYIVALWSTC